MKINKDSSAWKDFLTYSSRMFSFSFSDKLALYKNYPNATALATYEQWNSLGRRINYGSKAIKLTVKNETVNYFDIAQTKGEDISIWSYDERYNNNYIRILNGLHLCDVAVVPEKKMDLNISDYVLNSLNRRDSISSVIKIQGVAELISDSVAYMTYKRLGLDDKAESIDLEYISSVDDATLAFIGSETSDYARKFILAARYTVANTIPLAIEDTVTVVNDYEIADTEETEPQAIENEQEQAITVEENETTVNDVAQDNDDYNENEPVQEQEDIDEELVSEEESIVTDAETENTNNIIFDENFKKVVVFQQNIVEEQNKTAELVEHKHIMNFTNQLIYERFEKLFPEIVNNEYRYLRLEAEGYDPLVIEDISMSYAGEEYSIVHYYEQNGDLMRDPEITFVIDRNDKTIMATSYTQDNLGLYQDFTQGSKGRSDCESFFRQWLQNIDNQPYHRVKAIESGTDNEITFETELDIAKKAITDFCEREFGVGDDIPSVSFDNLKDVSLAFTTVTDFEIPLQVSADLVNCKINYMLGDSVLAKTDDYKSLKDLAEDVTNSSFDNWVSVYDNIGRDALEKYLLVNGYTQKVIGDGHRIFDGFLVDEWAENGLAGETRTIFTVVSNEFSDEYVAQAYITDGEFKGKYLTDYSYRPTKDKVFSDFTDKIAEIAIDRNEARAEGVSASALKIITLYKLGDFYEMYNEDAQVGARLLDRRILKKGGTNGMAAFSIEEYDKCIQKLRDNGYEPIVSETSYYGASAKPIELPPDLPELYSEHYNRLYEALNNVEGYDKAVEIGDEYIRENEEFVTKFNSLNGDIMSSDREVAAFAFALADAGLIDNFAQNTANEKSQETSERKGLHLSDLTDELDSNRSISYSIEDVNSSDFAKQIDAVLNGTFNRYNALKVCDTPKILLDVGCEQLPMLYTQPHLRNAIKQQNEHSHRHGLTIEQIKQIPFLIADPVMIMDSTSRNDSIVIVTSEFDRNNNPIVVSVYPNGTGRYELETVDTNFITSIYGRENFGGFLNRVVESDNLLYYDKEKSQDMLRVLRLQSSQGVSTLDSNIIIHQSYNIVNTRINKKFNEHYDRLYKALDNVEGYAKALEIGDEFIRNNSATVERFNSYRKDIMSSDREVAAFAFALADVGLIENFVEPAQVQTKTQEPAVTLMSDSTEVIEDNAVFDNEVEDYTMTFISQDDTALNAIKDRALSLGATCTEDLTANKLIVQTWSEHYDDLLLTAFENDVSDVETVNSKNNLIFEGYLPTTRYVVIHNDQYDTVTDSHNYPYNVQIWHSIEDNHFVYSGQGRFCKTLDEAKEYVENDRYIHQRLSELDWKTGDEIYFEDTHYIIENIDISRNRIDLLDNKTAQAEWDWYPLTRDEDLLYVLENYDMNEAKTAVVESIKAELPANFHIEDDNLSMVGGAKTKYKQNIEALKTLKLIESEKRYATHDEQIVLSQYVGWGGIPEAFDNTNSSWSDEYAELKALLTEDEYTKALATVNNAHYTQPIIIKAMYKAVQQFGIKGGNILEPSAAIGNFLGCMPDELESKSKLTAVEIDDVSGRICRQLYPQANIQITGFENAKLNENFFDLAIGNVPFGNYSVFDRKYNRGNALIHDYFVLKSLDMVRPNGIVAFITTSGTLDKKSSAIRQAISEKAELIGAIRLPNTAFKSNALTETVTDILFLQKRALPKTVERDWFDVVEYMNPDARNQWEMATGIYYNKYFEQHPEMICGTFKKVSGRYGDELTVEPFEDKTLEESLNECIQRLASNIVVAQSPIIEKSDHLNENRNLERIPAIEGFRNNDITIVNDKLFQRDGNEMVEYVCDKKNKELVFDIVRLANKARECSDLQITDISDEEYDKSRVQLFDMYTAFVKKNGYINSKKVSSVLNNIQFNDRSLLIALEEVRDNKTYPSAMLQRRVAHYRHKITHTDSVADAYQVSLAEKGRIDLPYISQLCSESIEDCITELNGTLMYRDPMVLSKEGADITEGWIPQDEYLSGNIRQKLSAASALVRIHPELDVNVKALERNMPERIKASDIACQLGSSWIPTKYIDRFIEEIFDMPWYTSNIRVEHNPINSSWYVSNKSIGNGRDITSVEYGTRDINALEILEVCLNLRDPKIYMEVVGEDGKPKRVVDTKKTELACNKAEIIKDKFKEWIYQDAERTRDLENIYNEIFNSEKNRHFDGSHLTFEGMSSDIELQEHQKNAVARVVYGGNALLAHCVGAGKTYEMTASAMEMRRVGLATKPLFVVPNHLVAQWGKEFYTLYPNAHILLATKEDFKTNKRKEFVARIATGDYDAVIMAYSTFEKIDVSPEKRRQYYREEINELNAIIEAERNHGKSLSVRNAQQMLKRLEKNLKDLEYVDPRDEEIYFEQLGVDALFVDEAHNFKNLSINTKLGRVSGINSAKSKRASDMLLKIRCIKEKNGNQDRNVVFATGTPISNSITEMYVMQKYLQPDYLKSKGLQAFDSWVADFAEISTQIELAPTGNSWRSKTRCNQFKNLPELMTMFKRCTDVQTAKMLDLPIPKLKNGQATICIIQPSAEQQAFIKSCGNRADRIHSRKVDPKIDNMLKVTNDGKMCALDFRLIDPSVPDDPASKVNCCIRNVFKKWEETKDDKLAQVIFLDRSTPSKDFNLYDDIKKKLIDKGVPEKEIAFIHDADTDDKKLKLFTDVNKGNVRVIIGSTEKLGAGTNMQEKLVALHHLDVPWRPADIEQREGRILRRGNTCDEVEIFRYATEGTFDSYSWQIIENKQKMISQVMTDKPMGRSIDDVDEQALSYAEIKSLATGDERIKEQLELSMEVTKLKSLKGQFLSEQISARDKNTFEYPNRINKEKELIERFKTDCDFIEHSEKPKKFIIKMCGGMFTDREEAGSFIRKLRDAHAHSKFELGNYRGFDLSLEYEYHDLAEGRWNIVIHRNASRFASIGTALVDVFNNIDQAIDQGFKDGLDAHIRKLEDLEKNFKLSQEIEHRTFPREQELREKTERLEKLTSELKLNDRSDNSGVYLDEGKDAADEDLDLTNSNSRKGR